MIGFLVSPTAASAEPLGNIPHYTNSAWKDFAVWQGGREVETNKYQNPWIVESKKHNHSHHTLQKCKQNTVPVTGQQSQDKHRSRFVSPVNTDRVPWGGFIHWQPQILVPSWSGGPLAFEISCMLIHVQCCSQTLLLLLPISVLNRNGNL